MVVERERVCVCVWKIFSDESCARQAVTLFCWELRNLLFESEDAK